MAHEVPLRPQDYEAIVALLYEWTGIRLQSKQQLVIGRLTPRLRSLGLDSFQSYIERVKREGPNGPEAEPFINQLTTNKTSFFRESHHFDYLRRFLTGVVAPRALSAGDRKVRVWSAACSTGEEAYTLAMVVSDALPSSAGWNVRIRASDIDTECLRIARAGEYDREKLEEIPAHYRERVTVPASGGRFKIAPELARLVTFEQLNLVRAPSFGTETFDAIFCRNVIIYFDGPTQQGVIERLSQRLTPGGRLYFGHSETLVGSRLSRVDGEIGVYRIPEAKSKGGAAPSLRPRRPEQSRRPPPPPGVPQLVRLQPLPKVRPKVKRDMPAATRAAAIPGSESLPHLRIVLGEWQVASKPTVISTLLGSCVSACLYDEQAGIGGMNHFMLPDGHSATSDPASFGLNAMELLINDLMQRGASRPRLRAKVFGAGAVTSALPATVGEANAAFIRAFLQREHIPLVVERLGGDRPREVFFRTDTGEALVRALNPQRAGAVGDRELKAWATQPKDEKFDASDALF